MKKQLVFVYGTLKKGFYFHEEYMGNGQSEFVSKAHTSNDYSLYIDALPHMVREESDSGVKGELYEVDSEGLKRLDGLEGHPIFYQREAIEVTDDKGEKKRAWAYLRPLYFDGKKYASKEPEFV